jgi:hypothetical protein
MGDISLHHNNSVANKSFEDIVENIEKIVKKKKR